jgi:hypothetical protein
VEDTGTAAGAAGSLGQYRRAAIGVTGRALPSNRHFPIYFQYPNLFSLTGTFHELNSTFCESWGFRWQLRQSLN